MYQAPSTMNLSRTSSQRNDFVAGETGSRADQTIETDTSLESTDEFFFHSESDGNDDACPRTKKQLPADFKPSDFAVIVGRGKKIRETIGNSRLRVMAGSYLTQYADAMDNRAKKTAIVNAIIGKVKALCSHTGGAFVRQSQGRWYEVSDRVAREKVGYVFRDLLHDQYGSSSKSKIAKRRRQQEEHEIYLQMMHEGSMSPNREVQPIPRQGLDLKNRPPQPKSEEHESWFDWTRVIDNESLKLRDQALSLPTSFGHGGNINLHAESVPIGTALATTTMNSRHSSTVDASLAVTPWNPHHRSQGGDGRIQKWLGDEPIPTTGTNIPERLPSYEAIRELTRQYNQEDWMTSSDLPPQWSSVSGVSVTANHPQLSNLQWEILRHHRHQQNDHQERNHNNYYEESVMMDDALSPRPFPPGVAGSGVMFSLPSSLDDDVQHQNPRRHSLDDPSNQTKSDYDLAPHNRLMTMGYDQQHNQGGHNVMVNDDVQNDDDGIDISQLLKAALL